MIMFSNVKKRDLVGSLTRAILRMEYLVVRSWSLIDHTPMVRLTMDNLTHATIVKHGLSASSKHIHNEEENFSLSVESSKWKLFFDTLKSIS